MSNVFYKIIAKKLGKIPQKNKYIELNVDYALVHDGTLVLTRVQFEKMNIDKIWDNERVIVVFDHIVPENNLVTANLNYLSRKFIRKHNIRYFYEGGFGICHQVMLEQKITSPGDILLGADSHTSTIGAKGVLGIGVGATDLAYTFATGKTWIKVVPTVLIKFKGKPHTEISSKDIVFAVIKKVGVDFGNYKFISFQSEDHLFPIDSRAVLCNMSVEFGAKSSIFEDENNPYHTDDDRDFDEVVELRLEEIEPHIVAPPSLKNIEPLKNRREKKKVDVVFIGTCAGGRLSDIEEFIHVIKGKEKHPAVRLLVCPASKNIYKQALKMGFIDNILEFGGIILPPSCGPCLGFHSGVLGDKDTCVSTGNRNFKGRMGSSKAKIYLTSAKVAASSAITGII